MTLKTTLSLAIAVPVALGISATAYAEQGETQLSIAGGASLATVAAFDGEGATEVFGGSFSVSHCVRNWLTLGVRAGYDGRSDLELSSASLEGLGGEGHVLFTDLQVASVVASARVYLDYGPFLRLRPIVGVGLGAQGIRYGSPALFLESGAAVAVGDTEWSTSVLKTMEVGVAYRITDLFETALLANVNLSDAITMYGLSLEFSWLTD